MEHGQRLAEKAEGAEQDKLPETGNQMKRTSDGELKKEPDTSTKNTFIVGSVSFDSDNQPHKGCKADTESISVNVNGGDCSGSETTYPVGSVGDDSKNQSQMSAKADMKGVSETVHGGDGSGSDVTCPLPKVKREKTAMVHFPSLNECTQKASRIHLPKVTRHSSFDTEQYRKGYPNKPDNPHLKQNLEFYQNERRCLPDGQFIDEIHKNWWGNYVQLEYCHTFIQWLFPIREAGMNFYAQELQLHEIKSICENEDALERLHKSYEMMLDFYGMRLKDRTTGEIERSKHYMDRFLNLNHSSHNYLRITRILKCLGEFGLERYKSPFVRFCLKEAIVERTLENTLHSSLIYWAEVVKDDQERRELWKYAHQLADQENKRMQFTH